MFALYNLSKDLVRKEAYFEVDSILEDLFQIKYEHDITEYKLNEITIFHKFFHDYVKIELVYSICYLYFGKFHRLDRPAIIKRDEAENIIQEQYQLNSERNRIDGPAVIEYDEDGNKIREEYWLNGKLHRRNDDEPTIINYDKQGRVISCEYGYHGMLHPKDIPAFVSYNY